MFKFKFGCAGGGRNGGIELTSLAVMVVPAEPTRSNARNLVGGFALPHASHAVDNGVFSHVQMVQAHGGPGTGAGGGNRCSAKRRGCKKY